MQRMSGMIIAIGCGSIFLMTGCATTNNCEILANSWIGKDSNELIRKWGPPNSTFEMPNKNKMFSWNFNEGAFGYSTFIPALRYGMSINQQVGCMATFEIDNVGKAASWSMAGNNCYCEDPPEVIAKRKAENDAAQIKWNEKNKLNNNSPSTMGRSSRF